MGRSMTMKTTEFFSSKFLTAADLKGKEHKLTIDRLEATEFKDGTVKPAMYFRNREKAMILNKTNTMKLAGQYGENMDDWLGKEVVVYPDTVDFQGKSVEAIRVRPVLPQVADEFKDDAEIPF